MILVEVSMGKKITSDQLIIPVYLNEKTVLDMLAITEDFHHGRTKHSLISSSKNKFFIRI